MKIPQHNNAAAESRPHYLLLDGLRGVAAVAVIWYHFGEAFATNAVDQMMNHGYLAVDFFFVLSGFVIGYAYDGRWQRGLPPWRFMLRRVIRLQPMLVLAAVLGAVAFMIQGNVKWDGAPVPPHCVLAALAATLFLIPSHPSFPTEIRGNGEMFPLNGPAWSLFFEYIGSMLYAFWLRSLSRISLAAVVLLSAAALAACALCDVSDSFSIGFGWSAGDSGSGLLAGFFRMAFSFSAGLLINRCFKPRHIRGAFWIAAAMIVGAMACPYIGSPDGEATSVLNAVYDLCCTFIIFPAAVYMGACGTATDRTTSRLCMILGELSYPVYIVHYPIMYLFYSWVWTNGLSFRQVWPTCIAIFAIIPPLAWLALKYYDEPVRRFLSRHFLANGPLTAAAPSRKAPSR